ncbi:MAG TPA: CoA transferase, partial [Dehalococcoidia bacterium]|nr:CoA transferase [Dehalococcoidia bacterium]
MTDPTPSLHRPLSGLRVIECGDPYAASYAARLLADGGADVVSLIGSDVRVPGAESADHRPESDSDWQDSAGLFAYLNRGKRLLRVEPPSPARRPDLKRLIAAADVVICRNSEDLERLVGSSLSAFRVECPRLIVVSVSPFGLRGPRAQDQADDLITLAGTDLLYSTPGIPDRAEDLGAEPPLRSNTYFGEFIGGLMGAIGAVFALINRDQTGRGDLVEVSKQEAVAAMMGWDLAMYSYGGQIIGRRPTHILQSPNHYLPLADGWVVLVAFLEPHWRALVDLMGNPDWADDPRFATGHTRGEHWGDLESLLLGW